jgi:hypothetical protein
MQATADPLVSGPVPAPEGALINAQNQRSADDPPFVAGPATSAATSP